MEISNVSNFYLYISNGSWKVFPMFPSTLEMMEILWFGLVPYQTKGFPLFPASMETLKILSNYRWKCISKNFHRWKFPSRWKLLAKKKMLSNVPNYSWESLIAGTCHLRGCRIFMSKSGHLLFLNGGYCTHFSLSSLTAINPREMNPIS